MYYYINMFLEFWKVTLVLKITVAAYARLVLTFLIVVTAAKIVLIMRYKRCYLNCDRLEAGVQSSLSHLTAAPL